MAEAPAALEVPALGYLAIGLLALCMAVSLRGIRAMWVYTFGSLLSELGNLLNYDKWVVHIHLGGPLLALDHKIQNAILDAAALFDGYAGYFFHGAAVLTEWAVKETEYLARQTLAWAGWMQHVHLPGYVKWAVRALVPPLLIYKLVQVALKARLPHLLRTVKVEVHTATSTVYRLPKALRREITHDHVRLGALAAAVAAMAGSLTWPHGIGLPNIGHVWRGLTRRLARAERRLRRLEGLFTVAGAAAIMANALGLPSVRCVTKGPLSKVSRALCGLGGQALNDLLNLLVDAAVLGDPCDTVTLLTDAVPLIMGPLDEATNALSDTFGRCHYHLPPPLAVAKPVQLDPSLIALAGQ